MFKNFNYELLANFTIISRGDGINCISNETFIFDNETYDEEHARLLVGGSTSGIGGGGGGGGGVGVGGGGGGVRRFLKKSMEIVI